MVMAVSLAMEFSSAQWLCAFLLQRSTKHFCVPGKKIIKFINIKPPQCSKSLRTNTTQLLGRASVVTK